MSAPVLTNHGLDVYQILARMPKTDSEFKVAIIGGGISGIAQAVTLKRQLGKSVDIKVSA